MENLSLAKEILGFTRVTKFDPCALNLRVSNKGKVQKKKRKKTNVSLYVCMSAGNSEMLVFISVF